jgi:hypothetical protein
VPFLVLAATAGVETPTARALPALGATAAGQAPRPSRDARAMGIEGFGRDDLLRPVRG